MKHRSGKTVYIPTGNFTPCMLAVGRLTLHVHDIFYPSYVADPSNVYERRIDGKMESGHYPYVEFERQQQGKRPSVP